MSNENTLACGNPIAEIQLPDREWSGALARATGKGALFSLYLSMHCQPGAQALKFSEEPTPRTLDDGFPERLNFYKRPGLKASDEDYRALAVTSAMANSGVAAAFSLWQSMHPDPLSAHDNATIIPPEIRHNCSLATQVRLASDKPKTMKVDESLLYEVIEGSSSLLTA